MQLQTRIFDLCDKNYNDLSELAQAMEISESQIDRIKEHRYQINQRFITGAIKAFPTYKIDELFTSRLTYLISLNVMRHQNRRVVS